MTAKLPRGWVNATIGDVTIAKVEQSEPTGHGNFPYIDIGSVDNQAKRIIEAKQTPVAKAPSRARQLVTADDVLVSMTRPNLNAVAMVPPSLDGATASTGFDVLRSNGTIAPAWLLHLVRSRNFVEELSSLVQGALYPAVRSTDIREYEFPLPPRAEQSRIVARLEKLEAHSRRARATLDAIPAQLAQARQSLLAAAFRGDLTADWRTKAKNSPLAKNSPHGLDYKHDCKPPQTPFVVNRVSDVSPAMGAILKVVANVDGLPELPETWRWVELGSYAFCMRGRFSVRPRNDPAYYGGSHPFIQIGDLTPDGGWITAHRQIT